MPETLFAHYLYVAKLLRLDGVKLIDNYPGDILHMANERIKLRKVVKSKKTIIK